VIPDSIDRNKAEYPSVENVQPLACFFRYVCGMQVVAADRAIMGPRWNDCIPSVRGIQTQHKGPARPTGNRRLSMPSALTGDVVPQWRQDQLRLFLTFCNCWAGHALRVVEQDRRSKLLLRAPQRRGLGR
jgi:hypothetical protein